MNDINDMNDISMNFVIECFLCVLQKEKEKEERRRKENKKRILVLMSRLFLGV